MEVSNVDFTEQSPFTTISIGPGIRGIERGIERVTRLNHIAYVEIEAFIIENLVAEMEAGLLDPAVIWSDAKTFPSHLFRGKVNLLLAGYPCQPFSNAGNRKGTEDPRHLYPHIARTIDIIRPNICLFENVRGHITLGLREVIESLEGMGYRVRWGIFSAEETGASHKRERVFIMAVRSDILENANCKSDRNNERRVYRETSSTGSELGNPQGKRSKQSRSTWSGGQDLQNNGCDELADTNNNGERARSSEVRSQSSKIEVQEQREERNEVQREWSGPEPCNIGELADPHNSRSQQDSECGELRTKGIEQSSINSGRNNEGEKIQRSKRSVARPGQVQHEWERPRTISYAEETTEPSLGMSAHGYRFREDFLRALGNSVYADTSELAWKTLWNKFL